MRRLLLLVPFALVAALAAAHRPALAGLFSAPEPELIYTGSGTDLTEGVLVIRDEEAFRQAIAPLDPAFGGEMPDFSKRTVLRIVGRARESRCRETRLIEVSTKALNATATMEEWVPDQKCPCAGDARAPKVFLVTVARAVRKADIVKTDKVLPCTEAEVQQRAQENAKPVKVFEGSWDHEPGAKLIVDGAEYRKVLLTLGIPDRGPVVNFERERVVAVTGRSRENTCRRTAVVSTSLPSPEEAVFDLEEHFAEKGQQCAQVVMHPQLFLYKVPATVMKAKVVSQDKH